MRSMNCKGMHFELSNHIEQTPSSYEPEISPTQTSITHPIASNAASGDTNLS